LQTGPTCKIFISKIFTDNAELSGIFSSVTASEAWFVMLEKISDSNVCSRRLRREQTWSNAQLGVRAAAGGANVSHHRQGKA